MLIRETGEYLRSPVECTWIFRVFSGMLRSFAAEVYGIVLMSQGLLSAVPELSLITQVCPARVTVGVDVVELILIWISLLHQFRLHARSRAWKKGKKGTKKTKNIFCQREREKQVRSLECLN